MEVGVVSVLIVPRTLDVSTSCSSVTGRVLHGRRLRPMYEGLGSPVDQHVRRQQQRLREQGEFRGSIYCMADGDLVTPALHGGETGVMLHAHQDKARKVLGCGLQLSL